MSTDRSPACSSPTAARFTTGEPAGLHIVASASGGDRGPGVATILGRTRATPSTFASTKPSRYATCPPASPPADHAPLGNTRRGAPSTASTTPTALGDTRTTVGAQLHRHPLHTTGQLRSAYYRVARPRYASSSTSANTRTSAPEGTPSSSESSIELATSPASQRSRH